MTTYFYHRTHYDFSCRAVVHNANVLKEKARIDYIVELDEVRRRCINCRDREGLLRVASEYAAFKMPITAQVIMREAECL